MRKILILLSLLLSTVASGQSAFAKAESLYSQSQYEKALPIYLSLLEQKPNDVKLLRATGQTYGKMEEYEKATEVYKRLLETDKKNAEYHFFYGGSMGLWAKNASRFKALGLLDDVKYHLKQATILDSKHIESRWALVQMYCELPGIVGGSLSVARDYAYELQKISPVDGYLAHGFIEEYDEQYNEAEEFYKKAIKVGGSPTTYLKLANLYADKMDRKKDAITTLKTAAAKHDDPKIKAALKKLDS